MTKKILEIKKKINELWIRIQPFVVLAIKFPI